MLSFYTRKKFWGFNHFFSLFFAAIMKKKERKQSFMRCRFEASKTSSISARESPSHCDAAPASGYFPASSSCQQLRGGAAPHVLSHHRQGRHYHFTGTRNYTQPSVDFYQLCASDDFGKMSRIAREWMFAQRRNLSCCCQANKQFRGLIFLLSDSGGVLVQSSA